MIIYSQIYSGIFVEHQIPARTLARGTLEKAESICRRLGLDWTPGLGAEILPGQKESAEVKLII